MLSPVLVVVAEINSMMVRRVVSGRAPPVHGDEAEHAVLDPVPLRRPRRVVADGDLETALFGQLGELDLPGPEAIAVGPPGVGGDQEALGAGEAVPAHLVPPAADGFDGEAGRCRPCRRR